jgi:HEAT repeat protein
MTHWSVRRLVCASVALSLCSSAALRAQDQLDAAPAAPEGVLAQEPQGPEAIFDAILLMLRIDRQDLAQNYLQQFLAAQPGDELLLQLRDRHGMSTFLQLSRIEALQPASQQLLKQVETAAIATLQDPAYFDSLIDRLQAGPREQEAAITGLRQLGADAVPGLLQRLGQGERVEQHNLLLYALTRIGPAAVPPLLAAIESPVERTRALAIESLGWLGDEAIVPHLLYPAFGKDQPPLIQAVARQAIARIRYGDAARVDRVSFNGVVDEVRDRALRHFSGNYEWVPDDDGLVEVWSFDPQQGLVVKSIVTPARASAFRTQRLAREAMLMSPERDDLQALFLAASLAEAGYRAGWDQPWPIGPGTAHNLALFSGAELTEQALQLALEHQNAAAAVGAIKALGQTATPALLVGGPKRKSGLVAALDYPHDRVQFAAAVAILQIDPPGHVPSAYRVVEILARAVNDGGRPASVVIDPNTARGASVAATLNALGYDAEVVNCGTAGFKTALARGDVQLAVVHPNVVCWELTQTVANFKADARTANIPVAIFGPQPLQHEMRWLLDTTPQAKYIVTGGEAADWRRQLTSLFNSVDVPPLTQEQRAQRIAIAAYWLRHIADGHRTATFDLAPAEDALSAAIEDPAVADDALAALAAIPRPSVQRRLAAVVTAPALPLQTRELAALELADHIRRFGRMLTDASVDDLRMIWHDSNEPPIRTALTAVLGTLGVSPGGTAAALQQHQLSPAP